MLLAAHFSAFKFLEVLRSFLEYSLALWLSMAVSKVGKGQDGIICILSNFQLSIST
jgi:hypothetical protein